jgi:hypothetical protein
VNVNNIYIAAANCQVALAFVKMASVEAGREAGRDFGFARQLVRKPAVASPRPKIAWVNTLLGEAALSSETKCNTPADLISAG